jgi:RecA-family ATPase
MLNDFEKQVKRADPDRPPEMASIERAIVSVSEFMNLKIKSKPALLDPWLKAASINFISGWRGAGKTFFAMALGVAVAKGEDFGPWKVKEPCPILYLDGEMTIEDDIERLKKMGITGEDNIPLYQLNK